ncbi:MarR family winged helix-turn-helix transcriptional regulator [Methylocystis sp.]|uniref:MarR family winged helix-turn-helix transcriptional regulator n=1 Tax=Methylocystis sp. TaxID=1911079 RepID=UPI003DA69473
MDTNLLRREVEAFAKINPEVNANMILAFLFIAQRGVCVQKDLEVNLGLTNASASRLVSWWTDVKRFGIDGVGFVERTEDPRDRRYKLLRLTPAGKKFYDKLRAMA